VRTVGWARRPPGHTHRDRLRANGRRDANLRIMLLPLRSPGRVGNRVYLAPESPLLRCDVAYSVLFCAPNPLFREESSPFPASRAKRSRPGPAFAHLSPSPQLCASRPLPFVCMSPAVWARISPVRVGFDAHLERASAQTPWQTRTWTYPHRATDLLGEEVSGALSPEPHAVAVPCRGIRAAVLANIIRSPVLYEPHFIHPCPNHDIAHHAPPPMHPPFATDRLLIRTTASPSPVRGGIAERPFCPLQLPRYSAEEFLFVHSQSQTVPELMMSGSRSGDAACWVSSPRRHSRLRHA
jgi:hypothetical protein